MNNPAEVAGPTTGGIEVERALSLNEIPGECALNYLVRSAAGLTAVRVCLRSKVTTTGEL